MVTRRRAGFSREGNVLESRKLIACQTQRIKGAGNRESEI